MHVAGGTRTFSKPKNLSLPSGRTGPASCSSFSRGVNCGAFGSFFAGGALDAGLWGAYSGRESAIALHCTAQVGRRERALTVPDFRRPKNEVMAGAGGVVARRSSLVLSHADADAAVVARGSLGVWRGRSVGRSVSRRVRR